MSLVEGLAQLLAELGHGAYRRGTPYEAGELAIILGPLLPESPDRLLVITEYAGGPEPDRRLPFSEPYVQLRTRGGADEDDSREACQALYEDLIGWGPGRLPDGTLVLSIIPTNAGPIPLGADPLGRFGHTLNVRIEYHNPTSRRPPL